MQKTHIHKLYHHDVRGTHKPCSELNKNLAISKEPTAVNSSKCGEIWFLFQDHHS